MEHEQDEQEAKTPHTYTLNEVAGLALARGYKGAWVCDPVEGDGIVFADILAQANARPASSWRIAWGARCLIESEGNARRVWRLEK